MNLKKPIARTAAVAVLIGAMMSTPALAQGEEAFSALRGVDAQALSSQEMDAIAGKLNAYDIAAALTALVPKLAAFPKWQETDLKLAGYFYNNAEAINAQFLKFGILTPCRTCVPPK
jgi:hypothetical protein